MQPALDLSPPDWPFKGLRYMGYGAILADPAWKFKNWSAAGETKNATQHYECENLDEICAWPVHTLAAKDCWLMMWTTGPCLMQAFVVMKAWGFTYVTAGGWAKRTKTGLKDQFGTGYVRRSTLEFYLIGKHGNPSLKPGARKIRNMMKDPVRQHSRKPDRTYYEIEESFHGPYLELNATQTHPSWDSFGRQLGKYDLPAVETIVELGADVSDVVGDPGKPVLV